jgi:hypothetical protein
VNYDELKEGDLFIADDRNLEAYLVTPGLVMCYVLDDDWNRQPNADDPDGLYKYFVTRGHFNDLFDLEL